MAKRYANLSTLRMSIVLILASGVAIASPATWRADAHLKTAAKPRFKAIAFDYFVLFNPDSVMREVERVFPGNGREMTLLWRTRQFEYSWLRSITDRYVDFFEVTEDALVYAAHSLKLELTPDDKRHLLDAYRRLTPWPDTVDGLRLLKASGIRMITLANFSPAMIRANAEHAGVVEFFDALVSTDANHTFKPAPRAYALGTARLHLRRKRFYSQPSEAGMPPARRRSAIRLSG